MMLIKKLNLAVYCPGPKSIRRLEHEWTMENIRSKTSGFCVQLVSKQLFFSLECSLPFSSCFSFLLPLPPLHTHPQRCTPARFLIWILPVVLAKDSTPFIVGACQEIEETEEVQSIYAFRSLSFSHTHTCTPYFLLLNSDEKPEKNQ